MVFTICVCLIYLGYRGMYTLNYDSPFAAFFSITLYLAEIYGNMLMFLYFFQIWNPVLPEPVPPLKDAKVDAYIPTYNEEPELLRGTIEAALAMDYPHETYVLDDGNRPEVRELTEELGAKYLNRDSNIHAKAGNLNHAMEMTDGEFIIVFDSDHVAERHFITRTLGYFADDDLAFIQTPHAYYNFDSFQGSLNYDKRYYWEEGQLFYNIVQPGKNHWNAASFCGSAAIFRKSALESVGLIATESITEDMQTGLRLHSNGWKSLYINERLVSGLAAPDLETFSVQRLRWGEGNLGTIFFDNPITMKGLSLPQRLNYLALMLSWTTGVQKLILYYTPLLMLLTGVGPVADMTWHLVAITVFYVLTVWYTVKASGNGYGQLIDTEITQMATFWTQCRGTWRALFNRKSATFVVTQKSGGSKESSIHDFLKPQYTFIGCSVVAMTWAASRYFLGVSEDFLGLSICSVLVFFHCVFAWVVIQRALAQRRFDWRHPCASHISYELETADGVQKGEGFTKDLCETGVGFLCYEKLNGHELNVTITAGDSSVTLQGRIRNWDQLVNYSSRKDGQVTCYRYGVQFINMNKEQLKGLWHICTKYAAARRYQEFDPNQSGELIEAVKSEKDHPLSVPIRLFRPDVGDVFTITESMTNTEFTFISDVDFKGKELMRARMITPTGEITGNVRIIKSKGIELGQMPLNSYRAKFDAFDGQSRGKLTTLRHLSHEDSMSTVTTLKPKKTKMPVLGPGAIVGTITAIAASLTLMAALFLCHDQVLMARAILGKPVDDAGKARLMQLVTQYERLPTSNERLFLRVRDAMKALGDEDAIARLDETLVNTTTFISPAARLQQAYMFEELGRVEDARKAFNDLIANIDEFASHSTKVNLILAAARNASHRKDYAEAVKLYDAVWKQRLRYIDIRAEYAGILAANQEHKRALEVLTSDDLTLDDLYLQASLLAAMKRYDRAKRIYVTLAQAYPDDVRAHKGAADVEAWNENFEKGIEGYEGVLARWPKHLETRIALAKTLVWDNQYRRAIRLGHELLPLLATEDELEVWIPMLEATSGLAEVTPQDQSFVMTTFGKRTRHPQHEYFFQTLANALIHCFEPDQAAPLVDQLVSMQPAAQALNTRYAQVLYNMGDFKEAAKHYSELLESETLPSNPRDRGHIYLAAALNSNRRGAYSEATVRYNTALDCFLQVMQEDPLDVSIWLPVLDAVAGAKSHPEDVVNAVIEIFNTRASIANDRQTMLRLADAMSNIGYDRFALQVLDELSTVHDGLDTKWRRANVLLRLDRNREAELLYAPLIEDESLADDQEKRVGFLLAAAANSTALENRTEANARYSQALLTLREQLQRDPDQSALWKPFLSAIAGMRTCSPQDLSLAYHIFEKRHSQMEDTEFVARLNDVLIVGEKHKMALPLFATLIQRRPDSVWLKLLYARSLQLTGDFSGAEKLYQELLEVRTKSHATMTDLVPEYELLLGAASNAAAQGKRRSAIALYRRALEPIKHSIERRIDNTKLWKPFLSALGGIGEVNEVNAKLTMQIYRNRDLHVDEPLFIAELAHVLALIGENQSAIDMLKQALPRFPHDQKMRAELARSLSEIGEFQQASTYYHWLLDKSDHAQDPIAHSQLLLQAAQNSRRTANREDAEKFSAKAFSILSDLLRASPNNSALWQPFLDAAAGAPRLSQEDRSLAVGLFVHWRQRASDPEFINRLTDVLVKCGDTRRAIILLEHVESHSPKTRLRLAMLLKEVGDYARAETRFRSLLGGSEFADDVILAADLLLAAAHNAQLRNDEEATESRYSDALRLLRNSVKGPINSALSLRYLQAIGGARELKDEDRAAFFEIQRSWTKHIDPIFRTRLVDVLLKLGQPKDALPILQALITQEPNVEAHQIRLANAHQSLNEFEEAELIYKELLKSRKLSKSDPLLERVLASAARNSLAQHDYEVARTRFDMLLEVTVDRDQYAVEYAIALEQTGDHEQAIRVMETTSNLTVEQRHLLASMYANSKDFAKAALEYESILAVSPNDAKAELGLANVAFWSKDYPAAIERYRELLSLDPDNQELEESLASALLWNGDRREALPKFTKLLQASPRNQKIWPRFLEAAAATKNLTEAQLRIVEQIEKQVDVLPLNETRELRASLTDVYSAIGDHAKSVRLLEDLLATSPRDDDLRAKYAIALVGVDRSEEALPLLVGLLNENPTSDILRSQLAYAYFAAGDYARADEQFSLLMSRGEPTSQFEYAQLLLAASNTSEQLNDKGEAIRRAEMALRVLSELLNKKEHDTGLWMPFLDAAAGSREISPDARRQSLSIFNNRDRHEQSKSFLTRICDVMVLLSRHRDSLPILQGLVRRYPNEIPLLERLANVHLVLEDYEKAIPILRRLAKREVGQWIWQTQLANALHSTKKYQEAEAIYADLMLVKSYPENLRPSLILGAARNSVALKQYAEAQRRFELRRELQDGTDSELAGEYAGVLLQLGEAKKVIELLSTRSLTLDQKRILAGAYESSGDPLSAREVYQQILLENPRDDAATTGLARIALGEGEFESAIELYSQLLRVRPNDRELTLNKSLAHLGTGEYALATDLLFALLQEDFEDRDVWLPYLQAIAGSSAVKQKHLDKALEISEELKGQRNVDSDLIVSLADVLIRVAMHSEALQLTKPYITLPNQSDEIAQRYANALLATDRPAEALPIFRAWSAKDSENAEARFLLGLAMHASGDYEAAEKQFRWLLRTKTEPQGNWLLTSADNAWAMGDLKRAERLSRSALERLLTEHEATPNDKARWSNLLRAINSATEVDAKTQEVVLAIYAKVTDPNVDETDIPRSDLLAALARAMVRLGRQDQAMALLDEVANQDPSPRRTREVYADVLIDVKRYRDAVVIYESLLVDDPTNVKYPVRLAQALYKLEDYSKAARYFDRVLNNPKWKARSRPDVGFLLSAAHNSRMVHRLSESNSRYRTALDLAAAQMRRDASDTRSWIDLLYAFSGTSSLDPLVKGEVQQLVLRIYEKRHIVTDIDATQQREFNLSLANALMRLGETEKSEALLIELLGWDDEDIEARLLLADLLLKRDLLDQAADQYERILAANPYEDNVRKRTQLWMSAADLYRQLDRTADAKQLQRQTLEDLRATLSQRVTERDLWMPYLYAFNAVRQPTADDPKIVLAMHAKHMASMVEVPEFAPQLADALAATGSDNEAIEILSSLGKNPKLYYRLGTMLSSVGRYGEALNYFNLVKEERLITKSDERYYDFVLATGNAQREMDERESAKDSFEEAVTHFRLAVSNSDVSELAWQRYLNALGGIRKPTELDQKLLRTAQSQIADQFADHPNVVEALCDIALQWQATDEASHFIDNALALHPDSDAIRLAKVRALYKLEQFKQADAMATNWFVDTAPGKDNLKNTTFEGDKWFAWSMSRQREVTLLLARIKAALDDFPAARTIFETVPNVEQIASLEYAVTLANTEDRPRAIEILEAKEIKSGDELGYLVALYIEDQNFKPARTLVEELLKRDPENVEVQRLMANVLFWSRDYEAAIVRYEQLIRKLPEDLELRESLGKSLLWIGRYDESINMLADVYHADESKKKLWIPILEAMMASNTISLQHSVLMEIREGYLDTPLDLQLDIAERLSRIFVRASEPMLARQCLLPYITAGQAPPSMTLEYADVLAEFKDFTQAIKLYLAYLERTDLDLTEGEVVETRLRYADLLHRAKEYTTAHEELTWALTQVDESKPAKYKHALLSMARNLVALNRSEEALERFHQLLDFDPQAFDLHEEFAAALLSAARPKEALTWLNRAAELSLDGEYLLGAVYSNLEEFDRAVNVYKHIVKERPRQLKAWRLMADAATWAKDYRLGIHLYKQLLSRAPDDESLQIGLANAYLWSGQYQRALNLFVTVLRKSPDRYDLWIAVVNAAAGDEQSDPVQLNQEARRLLQRIASSRRFWPDNRDFKRGMAEALFRYGDRGRAMAMMRELIAADPSDRKLLRTMADALHEQGEYEEAERYYNLLLRNQSTSERLPREVRSRPNRRTRNATLEVSP